MDDAELFAPTTEQVRMEYVVSGADAPTPRLHLRAEFDRWLAAHDREVAENCARIAASSTVPLPGRGSLEHGSRSQWYANGVNDSAARIRAAFAPPTETNGTAP